MMISSGLCGVDLDAFKLKRNTALSSRDTDFEKCGHSGSDCVKKDTIPVALWEM